MTRTPANITRAARAVRGRYREADGPIAMRTGLTIFPVAADLGKVTGLLRRAKVAFHVRGGAVHVPPSGSARRTSRSLPARKTRSGAKIVRKRKGWGLLTSGRWVKL